MGKVGSKHGFQGLATDERESPEPEPSKSLIVDDPRSPSQEVERTPIKTLDLDKDVDSNEFHDPRSPSADVPRTPLHKLDLKSEDPREPTSGIARTPLNKENVSFSPPDILGAIEEEGDHHSNTENKPSKSLPVQGDEVEEADEGDDVILKETNEGKRKGPRSKSLGQLTSRASPSYCALESDENDVGEGVIMGSKRKSLPSISKGYNKLELVEDSRETKEDTREPLSEKNEIEHETEEKDTETEKEPDADHTESSQLITVQ
ncbi:uncharacterized protein LOC134182300 [Corticium candelabrum]|uniref:uncharacterized protein LOC134182300 n=1 Tax=Corticium candelabrum TaxID=121492 RepID=UPI002E274E29|nr:uncharacterized protein LOC134182300 [Corticium candelabrum]